MNPSAHPERPRWKGFVAAAVVVSVWTGFNIVSRLAGKSPLTPFDVTALRFAISGVVMLPLFFFRPRRLSWPRRAVIIGCGGLFYALCVYTGFAFAPAAHAGVLVNGGIPLASTLLAWLWLGERPGPATTLSLACAATGLLVIAVHQLGAANPDHPQAWIGDLCFVAGALSWALYGLLVRHWHIQPLEAVSTIASGSALAYLPVYWLWLPKGLVQATWGQIWLQALYQGALASLVAAFGFAYATLSLGSGVAALLLAIVPGTTALLAAVLLDEPLTASTGFGVLLVTAGALIGARARHRPGDQTSATERVSLPDNGRR